MTRGSSKRSEFVLRAVDRLAALLLALAAAGHGFVGTLMSSPLLDSATMWSFSGSVAAWAIAVLNWLRAGRPDDRPLALWSLAGALAWIGLMAWLMAAAGMWNDPRPWSFVAVCAILALFAVRDVTRDESVAAD
jgi:hypothetical protein